MTEKRKRDDDEGGDVDGGGGGDSLAAHKVALHYSGRDNQSTAQRQQSPIYHLRCLNNWVRVSACVKGGVGGGGRGRVFSPMGARSAGWR